MNVDRKQIIPGGITCRMQPSRALLASLGKLGVVDPREALDVCKALDDLVSVDKLAELMDKALSASCKPGGTVDMKDAAAFILRELKEHQFGQKGKRR